MSHSPTIHSHTYTCTHWLHPPRPLLSACKPLAQFLSVSLSSFPAWFQVQRVILVNSTAACFSSGPLIWRNRDTHTPQSYPPSCCTSSLHTHMLPVVVLVWPSPPVCSLLAMNRSDWLPVSLSSLPVCTGMNGHIIHSDAVPPLTPILTLYTAFCSFSFSLCLFHSSEDNSMSSQWYNSKPLPPPPSALPPLPHHSVLQYQPLEQQSPGLTA